MNTLNREQEVKEQYKNSEKLDIRLYVQTKYSTNQQGFSNFIFLNYEIPSGAKVLELGCGTGSMWKEHLSLLSDTPERKGIDLTLTDFSEGMLQTTRENLPERENLHFFVVDIQNIPFPTDSFDVVIANMMLYHVPDLKKGLSEVRRVLRPQGSFYAATYGENGILPYVSGFFKEYGIKPTQNTNFTLQNGEQSLRPFFQSVERRDYIDSLVVTNISDMVAYIKSLSSFSELPKLSEEVLFKVLTANSRDGVLSIPKEYGMFLCH